MCVACRNGHIAQRDHRTGAGKKGGNTPDIAAEAAINARVAIGIDEVSKLGEQSLYSCPDCGGGLWRLTDDELERYRCHIGHSYSEKDLVFKQAEATESTLWVALRMMEERRVLLAKIEVDCRTRGFVKIANDHAQRVHELEGHISKMKEILYATQQSIKPDKLLRYFYT